MKLIIYGFIFLWELIKANIQVTRLVFSPRLNFKTGAIRYKTKVKNVRELVLLSNSITLTPGTLVMDANLKKGELLVHVMSTEVGPEIKKNIENSLERRVIWALRYKKNG